MRFALVTFGTALLMATAPASAGMMQNEDNLNDQALTSCIRANTEPGGKSHTGNQAKADFDRYISQCDKQMKALMLDCRVAGKTNDECALALLSFMTEAIDK